MTRFSPLVALFLLALPGSAAAGFYLEGLEPYSIRACDESPSTSDPVISLPPEAVEGSPSAFNDGGIPRFSSAPCPEDDGKGRSSGQPRPHAVPQK